MPVEFHRSHRTQRLEWAVFPGVAPGDPSKMLVIAVDADVDVRGTAGLETRATFGIGSSIPILCQRITRSGFFDSLRFTQND